MSQSRMFHDWFIWVNKTPVLQPWFVMIVWKRFQQDSSKTPKTRKWGSLHASLVGIYIYIIYNMFTYTYLYIHTYIYIYIKYYMYHMYIRKATPDICMISIPNLMPTLNERNPNRQTDPCRVGFGRVEQWKKQLLLITFHWILVV